MVLGYLDPDFFLGGEMRLDAHAARAAIERDVAAPAGLDPIRAAWGVHEIASEDVARAFRIHASERGFDYRSSSMVAFGGSGPVHALAIARKLRIPRVVFPIGAGSCPPWGCWRARSASRSRGRGGCSWPASMQANSNATSRRSSKRRPDSCTAPG